MMGFPFVGMGLWMIFGSIFFIAFWGAVIWLIVWAVRKANTHTSGAGTPGENALDFARTRYARGEITRNQFEQIKKDLS